MQGTVQRREESQAASEGPMAKSWSGTRLGFKVLSRRAASCLTPEKNAVMAWSSMGRFVVPCGCLHQLFSPDIFFPFDTSESSPSARRPHARDGTIAPPSDPDHPWIYYSLPVLFPSHAVKLCSVAPSAPWGSAPCADTRSNCRVGQR